MSGGRAWTPKNIARSIVFGRLPYITYAPEDTTPTAVTATPVGSLSLVSKKPPFTVPPILPIFGLSDGTVSTPLLKSPYVYPGKSHPKSKKHILFAYSNFLCGINGTLIAPEFASNAVGLARRRIVTHRGIEVYAACGCSDAVGSNIYSFAASARSHAFGPSNVQTHLDRISLIGAVSRVVDIRYDSVAHTVDLTVFHDTLGTVDFPGIMSDIPTDYDLPKVLSCCLSPDGKYFSSVFIFSKATGGGALSVGEYTILDVIIRLNSTGVATGEGGAITMLSSSGKTDYLATIANGFSVNVSKFTFKMYTDESIVVSANTRTTLATITQYHEQDDGMGGTIPAVSYPMIQDTGNTVTSIAPVNEGTPVLGVVYSSLVNVSGDYDRFWVDVVLSFLGNNGLPVVGSYTSTRSYEYRFFQNFPSTPDVGITDGVTGIPAIYTTNVPGSADAINTQLPGRRKEITYSVPGVGLGFYITVNGFHVSSTILDYYDDVGTTESSFKSELVWRSTVGESESYLVTIVEYKNLIKVETTPPAFLINFLKNSYTVLVQPDGDDVALFTSCASQHSFNTQIDATLSTEQRTDIAELYPNGGLGTNNPTVYKQLYVYRAQVSGGGVIPIYQSSVQAYGGSGILTPDIVDYPNMAGFTKNSPSTTPDKTDYVTNEINFPPPKTTGIFSKLSDDYEVLKVAVNGSELLFINGNRVGDLQYLANAGLDTPIEPGLLVGYSF